LLKQASAYLPLFFLLFHPPLPLSSPTSYFLNSLSIFLFLLLIYLLPLLLLLFPSLPSPVSNIFLTPPFPLTPHLFIFSPSSLLPSFTAPSPFSSSFYYPFSYSLFPYYLSPPLPTTSRLFESAPPQESPPRTLSYLPLSLTDLFIPPPRYLPLLVIFFSSPSKSTLPSVCLHIFLPWTFYPSFFSATTFQSLPALPLYFPLPFHSFYVLLVLPLSLDFFV